MIMISARIRMLVALWCLAVATTVGAPVADAEPVERQEYFCALYACEDGCANLQCDVYCPGSIGQNCYFSLCEGGKDLTLCDNE